MQTLLESNRDIEIEKLKSQRTAQESALQQALGLYGTGVSRELGLGGLSNELAQQAITKELGLTNAGYNYAALDATTQQNFMDWLARYFMGGTQPTDVAVK